MATIKQIKDTAGTTHDIAVKWDNVEGKPNVGNGTITIKQGGTKKGSFTVNQTGNTTIELTDNNSHNTSKNIVGSSSKATANAAVSSNGVYLNHLEESTVTSSHKISGSGTVSVTSDSSGNITITGSNHTTPGNGKITIKQGGTEKGSFTVNQTGVTTIELTDNNTTYTFATGDSNGQIKVTPSGGSATNISVKGLGSLAYKSSLSASDVGASASGHNHDSVYAPKSHTHDYLPLSGGTLTGTTTLSRENGSMDTMFYTSRTDLNSGTSIGFGIGTSNNRGIYDSKAGGWILKVDTNNNVTLTGTATKADALTVVSKGSATQPVYFDANGKPVACTYTLGKSVPSDAKFTDTTYTALKNPNAIKFKNISGTEVTYDGSSAVDLTGGVYYAATAGNATTATNLANKPTLSIGPEEGDTICVTVGGKTSSEFTVPYATNAGNATNDGGGNNISATYALKADFEGFTEYVESDFVKKTGSLKNPNAIKFKNTSGTVITYDGSSAADLTGGVYYAATAGNATNADKLKIGLVSGSEEKRLSICATSLTQSGGYGDVYQIPNITLNGGEFTIGYETYINSKLDVGAELHVTGGDILCGNIKCNESITADGGFNGNLNGTATNATNDGSGNNISATYALKIDFEGFTEYVESDFVKKTGSLKNPNAIKFKNALGTVITYDGSSAADLSGGVYNATTATTATTATNASNVKVNTSTANSNLPILFTTTYPSTGTKETASNRAVYVDSEKNKFYYNPNSNQVTAAGGFFETSDERLKDIVNPITVDLDKLSKLRKVYFNWKDKPDSDLQLGMIAQDVQELYPELVSEADGQLSLSYEKLSVIALEAIDVLHNENNELKSRIERLESLVNQLAEKVND